MARAEEPAEPRSEPVLITRYPNRRLYDRNQARYVTLPEIAELVRNGRTVTVRDSKTGEDLTRLILTQIILDHYPERMALFPVNVLNSIIQANDTALRFLHEYFQQSLTYLDLLQQPAAANPMLLPLHWLKSVLPIPPSGPPTGATNADSAALLRRLEELERRLDEVQARDERSAPTAPQKEAKGRKNSEPS